MRGLPGGCGIALICVIPTLDLLLFAAGSSAANCATRPFFAGAAVFPGACSSFCSCSVSTSLTSPLTGVEAAAPRREAGGRADTGLPARVDAGFSEVAADVAFEAGAALDEGAAFEGVATFEAGLDAREEGLGGIVC